MSSKKELTNQIKSGNLQYLNELLRLEYEEIKETLIDMEDDSKLKRLQGAAKQLRELIILTNKTTSF